MIARLPIFMLHTRHISTSIILSTNGSVNWVIGKECVRQERGRQTKNMRLVRNSARHIFHWRFERMREIETGLATTDAIASRRDRKRMMRWNKYAIENLRATWKLTGFGDTEQMGLAEESQILGNGVRKEVTCRGERLDPQVGITKGFFNQNKKWTRLAKESKVKLSNGKKRRIAKRKRWREK